MKRNKKILLLIYLIICKIEFIILKKLLHWVQNFEIFYNVYKMKKTIKQ